METDFTVLPVRFRSKASAFIFVLFLACSNANLQQVTNVRVNANDTALHHYLGTLYYHKQPLSGYKYELYTTGDTALLTAYVNGKEHGISRRWYKNKQLAEERLYVQGRKEGLHKGWWQDGKPKFEYHFLNDEHEGQLTEWFTSGKISRIFHYSKGYEDGSQKMWWENGDIRANYVVKNGERFGLIGQKLCKNIVDKP